MSSGSQAARANDTNSSSAGAPAGASARPAVDITAITTRDDFLLELGEILAGRASIRPVDSVEQALEHLASTRRGQLLVIDAREPGELRKDIKQVQAQAPHASMLVFSENASHDAELTDSGIFGVLPLPLDPTLTGTLLEGAMADALARKTGERPAQRTAAAPARAPAATAATSGPTDPEPGNNKLLMIAGAALIAAAIGAWFFLGRQTGPAATQVPAASLPASPVATPSNTAADKADGSATAAALPRPAVETSLLTGKVDDLLERGRLAMRERRYSEPAGDNALLYYRSAAAADPANAEAADGLQRVAAVLASRFDEAVAAGRFDEASSILANFKAAVPADSRAAGMDVKLMVGQVNRALADGNTERANLLIRQAQAAPGITADQILRWKADSARRAEEVRVQKFATLVMDRIHDGRLIEPADDSARLYLGQLREAAPANPATQRLTHELNAAYLHKAREAALANHSADSERWLTEARTGGVTAAEITAFQKDLSAARQKAASADGERLAQLVRDRTHDGRLTDPAQDSAAYYLGQLQSSDPNNANTAALGRELATQLLERAKDTVQSGKGPASIDSDLALAKRLGADPKDVLAVQQLQNSGRPGQSAAARSAAASGVDAATLAASLKRSKYLAPTFPPAALAKNLSGVVTLEFTVGVNGETRDIRVVEATPPGVFDTAAMNAVKHWHYDPVLVNGTAVAVPTRTAIRFELPK